MKNKGEETFLYNIHLKVWYESFIWKSDVKSDLLWRVGGVGYLAGDEGGSEAEPDVRYDMKVVNARLLQSSVNKT